MRLRKLISFALIVLMVLSVFTGCQSGNTTAEGTPTKSVRQETLFVTGMQWGAAQNFNWFSGWPAWPTNLTSNPMVYETMFLYNMKTNEFKPWLATSYEWTDEFTITVKLNPKAKFSDGEVLDSSDVKYTMEAGQRYSLNWSGYWENLLAVEAPDAQTVVFKGNPEKFNRLNMLEIITRIPVLPEHIWTKVEADNGNDFGKIAAFFNDKPVGSGSYLVDFHDETQIRCVRNDNWWGKEDFGLPKPKYITHLDYTSNDTATLALKNNELDYSENFIAQVWDLKPDGVKTYLSDKPYYEAETLPTLYINLHKAGLDQVEVRKAIAYSLNYPEITEKAMNGYSKVIEPSLMVFDYEKELVDMTQITPLQWGYDVDKANALLDSINAVPGADGIRVLPDGTRLGPWNVECPAGWTEWNATIEIACQNAKKVGIELVPSFPDWSVYDNNKNVGTFDISMVTPAGFATPGGAWKRAYDLISSESVAPMGEQAFWNFGRYDNQRVNDILDAISKTEDKEELKKLNTELNVIYLTDCPTIPLYYRPTVFFTFNEKVWKNFPSQENNTTLPGALFDGAGFLGIFQLTN